MKVLIIGGGGREHALAYKVALSPQVERIFVAPGNAGTELENKTTNINIADSDSQALLNFALENNIDLTLVGPEAPLANGIVDLFLKNNLKIFGPTQQAAMLETSKAFCKQFLADNGIPTAAYQTFTEIEPAIDYAKSQSYPLVIKASGLAAGKGVIIAEDFDQAEATIKDMLAGKKFGDASSQIVIEEFLQGEELSYIVMVDGEHILPLASSQDHKRLQDGDAGPNTGGMGAYSPAPLLTETLEQTILSEIMEKTVQALQKNNTPYTGFLYAGLMIDDTNQPKVLEFNCRLGDPETQPLMMRLQSDLIGLIEAALAKKLHQVSAQWDPRVALSVVMAAGGYPLQYKKGDTISGLNQINQADVKVFHAGTKLNNGNVLTNGGRVLAVTALGETTAAAQQKAYQALGQIQWPNVFYRKDIGHRAL